MVLYIFDRDLNFQGILEGFFSLQWIRRYHKAGEFELHCALDPETLSLLEKENILYKKGDSEAGYIEYRNIRQDQEGKEVLVVRGKFLTDYLNRRIVWETMNLIGSAEEKMKELVDTQCITTNSDRLIDNLGLSINKGFTDQINYQVSYKQVLDELEKISKMTNLGYRIDFDINNKRLVFDVYKGIDRSINQEENSPCIFSQDFENILEQQYTDSNNNYRNVALVAGQGEGSNRTKVIVGEGAGLDRYEMFVDAKNINNESADNTSMTKAEYENVLIEEGRSKLASRMRIKTFDSRININSNLKYKVDFNLGDIVTIINKKWNIKLDTRITEINETYEKDGLLVDVTFGNNVPTLIDKIKENID